jgi:outer membrane receptor protein involved in Fe transport
LTGEFDKSVIPVNDHTAYDDHRLFSKLSYDISDDTRITMSGNFVQSDTENGSTTYQTQPQEKDTQHTFYFVNLHGQTVINDQYDLDLRLFSNYTETDATTEHIQRDPDGGGGPMGAAFLYLYGQRLHSGRDTGIQFKAGTNIGDHNYLIAGIDSNFINGKWENKNEDGSLIGEAMDEDLNNQAVYLQNESEFFSSLFFTLGLRYDINSISDNSVSPKVGLLYRLNDRIDLRSSVGRAYRAPNLNELYTPTWMMVPGVPFESHPDLEPEIVWSYDLGTTIRISDHLSFNFAGFYSKAEDLIANPITNGVMRYENMDEVETDGFETGVDGNLFSWLEFYLNYTYTHSVEEGGGRLDNQPLFRGRYSKKEETP